MNQESKDTGREEISDSRIQWHPAFCAAAELEFLDNHEELESCRSGRTRKCGRRSAGEHVGKLRVV